MKNLQRVANVLISDEAVDAVRALAALFLINTIILCTIFLASLLVVAIGIIEEIPSAWNALGYIIAVEVQLAILFAILDRFTPKDRWEDTHAYIRWLCYILIYVILVGNFWLFLAR